MIRYKMITVLVGAVSVSLGCLDASEPPKPTTASTYRILKDYKDNAVAADLKYNGKMVKTAGSISVIGETSLQLSATRVGDERLNDPVREAVQLHLGFVPCRFADDQKHLVAKLAEKEHVGIVGKCIGREKPNALTSTVIIVDCEIHILKPAKH